MRFADSALEFEVRVFVSEYVNQNLVRHKINKEIDRVFREHHISIPFPQRDVHVFNHFADDTVQGNVTENNRL
jgi:potassium efflux system protein